MADAPAPRPVPDWPGHVPWLASAAGCDCQLLAVTLAARATPPPPPAEPKPARR